MKVDRLVVIFDAPDLEAESTFWAGLLDGTVDAGDEWHGVAVDWVERLGFQLAPNHVPPDWPDGMPQQQLHLDVWIDDLREGHQKAISLGARLLRAADDPDAPSGFQVYTDPAGHPFCLCWDKGSA